MSTMMTPEVTPQQLADDAAREVLRTQYQGVTALRLDSPPGAGKTGIVERLFVQGMELLRERCMVVTQTNEQAFDLARRLAVRDFPRLRFTLFVTRTLQVPDYLLAVPNLMIVREGLNLPVGPCVVNC